MRPCPNYQAWWACSWHVHTYIGQALKSWAILSTHLTWVYIKLAIMNCSLLLARSPPHAAEWTGVTGEAHVHSPQMSRIVLEQLHQTAKPLPLTCVYNQWLGSIYWVQAQLFCRLQILMCCILVFQPGETLGSACEFAPSVRQSRGECQLRLCRHIDVTWVPSTDSYLTGIEASRSVY